MNKPTNINHAPKDATHWAPEMDAWTEAYYRLDSVTGLWHAVNAYWASDVDERPTGFAACRWRDYGLLSDFMRPLDHLIPIDTFFDEATKPEPVAPSQAEIDKADAERYRFLKTFTHFDTALESYCGMDMLDPDPESNGDYIDDTIDKAIKDRMK